MYTASPLSRTCGDDGATSSASVPPSTSMTWSSSPGNTSPSRPTAPPRTPVSDANKVPIVLHTQLSHDALRNRLPSDAQVHGPFFAQSPEDVLDTWRTSSRRVPSSGTQPELSKTHQWVHPQLSPKVPSNSSAEPIVQPHLNATATLSKRQSPAQQTCFVGNEILSCYPTSDTSVTQGTWSEFIWNQNYPLFRQRGAVDIYLFRQDTDTVQASWMNQNNNLGRIAFSPEDSYWAGMTSGDNLQPGQQLPWRMYFVITQAGQGLSSQFSRLSTWSAVQTALPSSVVASRSSASVASASSASMASVASASSASSASAASASTLSSVTANPSSLSATGVSLSTSTGLTIISGSVSSFTTAIPISGSSTIPSTGYSIFTGSSLSAWESSVISSLSTGIVSSLRSEGLSKTQTSAVTITTPVPGGSIATLTATAQADGGALNMSPGTHLALPVYAIVLISVFGFLALILALVLSYLFLRWWRRHHGTAAAGTAAMASSDSNTPMMRDAENNPSGSVSTPATDHPQMTELPDSPTSGVGVASGAAGAAGAGAAFGAAAAARDRPRSDAMPARPSPDGDRSGDRSGSADAGISSDEATRMADAFRSALRKPDFPSLSDTLIAGTVAGTVGSGLENVSSSSPTVPAAAVTRDPATASTSNDSRPTSTPSAAPIRTNIPPHRARASASTASPVGGESTVQPGSLARSSFPRTTSASAVPLDLDGLDSPELTAHTLLERELASEGQDVRSVQGGRVELPTPRNASDMD